MLLSFILIIYCLTTINGLKVNEACTTPNNEQAKCISIYSCPTLRDAVKTNDTDVIDFLRESQCGAKRGEPLVCCGSSAAYQSKLLETTAPQPNTTTTTTTRIKLHSRLGSEQIIPDRSRCGFMADQFRIYFGTATGLDEFPWMALLEYRVKASGRVATPCGGVLISRRYVLTAAHCLVGQIKRTYTLERVRLGEYNTESEQDCTRQGRWRYCADPVQYIGIETATAHQHYDTTSSVSANDIGIIRLNQDAQYSDYVQPICLPESNEQSAVGRELIVAGWGKTERGRASALKLKTKVPIASRQHCRNVYKTNFNLDIRDTQMCAGGEKSDSCTGDSGGPLMNVIDNGNDQWYVEGLVSFGNKCGQKGFPAVYTRVEYYLDWIRENMHA